MSWSNVCGHVHVFRYSVDETSPEECAEDAIFEDAEATTTYQILSKPIVVRQSAAKGHAANGGAHQFAAPVGCCGNHCHRH